MMKEAIITNRFSPGDPAPIFFAGRQEELTKLYLALIEFANSYSLNHCGAVHFMTGDAGVGKTTLFLKLRHQVAYAPEFEKWISVYISVLDVRREPAAFIKIFLQDLEKNIVDSGSKRETISNFLGSRPWQRAIAKIVPEVGNMIQKSLTGGKVSLSPFFKSLREHYTTAESLPELLAFCNFLLEGNGYFLLLIIDHLEEIRRVPGLSAVLLPCIEELGKKQWRYFTLVGTEGDAFPVILDTGGIRASPLANILSQHSAIVIKGGERLSFYEERLARYLFWGKRLQPLAILAALNAGEIVTTLYNRCRSEGVTSLVECSTQPDIPTYLTKAVRPVREAAEAIFRKTAPNAHLPNDLATYEINERDDCPAIEKFCKFLTALDRHLQNYPEAYLIVFLKNFEYLVPVAPSKPVQTKSITWKVSASIPPSGADIYLPSPAFLNFYSSLLQWIYSLQRISLVPIFVLPDSELPADGLIPEFAQKTLWRLNPLREKEGIRLIQEIAMRCGAVVSREIAQDIYRQTRGNSLFLHHYGYYLLSTLQEALTTEEVSLIKNCLLKNQDSPVNITSDKLCKGADGKYRLYVPEKHYQETAAIPPGKLYQRMVLRLSPLARELFAAVLFTQNAELSPARLWESMRQKNPELEQKAVQAALQELEDIRLILREDNEIIVHSLVRSLSRWSGSITTRQMPRWEVQKERTQSITRVRSEGKTFELLHEALSSLKAGELPSLGLLNIVSAHLNLRETSPLLPLSISYIYTLGTQLAHQLVQGKPDEIVSAFKSCLEQSEKGKLDLRQAVEQIFLGEKMAESLSNQNNFFGLSRLYFLRYRLLGQMEELEKAVDFYVRSFLEDKKDADLLSLGRELDEMLARSAELKNAPQLRIVVERVLQILTLEQLEDAHSRARGLLRLTPNLVPKEFHKYILAYLESTICKDTTVAVKEAALYLLGCYGHRVAARPGLLEILDEVIQKAQYPLNKQASAASLTYFFPFLEKDQTEQIIEMIEARLLEEANPILRISLLKVLANSCNIQHQQRMIQFLQKVWQNEADTEVRIAAWHILSSYKPFCPREIQTEISEALVDYYDTVLQAPPVRPYTETLLIALHGEPQKLAEVVEKILRSVRQYSESPLWNNAASLIPTVFPILSIAQKEEIAALLAQWIGDSEAVRRMAGFSNFFLLYPYADNVPQFLEDLANDKFSLEQGAVFQEIWRWIGYLKPELRTTIVKKMLEVLDVSSRMGDYELYSKSLRDLAAIAPYFSEEEKEIFSSILFYAVRSGDVKALLPTMERAPEIFPYLKVDLKEEMQRVCYYRIALSHAEPHVWAVFMKMLSCCSFIIDDIYNEAVFYRIAGQIAVSPSELLGPALSFFATVWTKLPEELVSDLKNTAQYYLAFTEYADPALAFLIRCGENLANFMRHVYFYQFYENTAHLAFCLYEIYPELSDTASLAENYEHIVQKAPYPLVLRMADFHFRVAASQQAEQWITWILKEAGSPIFKIKALSLQRKWQLLANEGDKAQKTLERIHEITFG